MLRRAAEKEGPKSPTMFRAIQDIDDVLQAKLIDIRSKEERAGIKVSRSPGPSFIKKSMNDDGREVVVAHEVERWHSVWAGRV